MAYVIAEPCVAVCDTACVEVCPVDCIHGPADVEALRGLPPERRPHVRDDAQMFIDPEACICCGACEPQCPVNAIFDEPELPPQWARYRERNADFFRQNQG
jgi:NAD-dependent dihydropyrimidine dehydrogenase PreA subunit